LLARYTPSRRRATLAALLIELEARLIDAALDMADRMIGGSFTRGGTGLAAQRFCLAPCKRQAEAQRCGSVAIAEITKSQLNSATERRPQHHRNSE
jgi:hypothetical protein